MIRQRKPIKRTRRPKRVSPHQALVNEADAWVKAIVLNRQGPECLKCHKIKPLQAAHILSKGANNAIRFELENVIGLCVACHIFWGHRDSSGFADWIDEIFPGRRAMLKLSAQMYRKIDLKELICVLKSIHRREVTGAEKASAIAQESPQTILQEG